jgi:WD40 repeat protein
MDKYYQILGLKPNASPEEVKKAYRQLVKIWHPDRFHNNDQEQKQAEVKFKEIAEAYEVLKDYIPGSSSTSSFSSSSTTGIKVKRTSPEMLYQRGVEFAEKEKYQEAIEEFSQAIRCDETFIKAYQYRGFILDKLGYKQRAESDLRKATELKCGKPPESTTKTSFSVNNPKKSTTNQNTTSKTQTQKTNPTKSATSTKSSPSPSRTVENDSKWKPTFISNNASVTCISINKIGNLLATGHQDNSIYLWDLNLRKHIGTFRGHSDVIRSLIFQKDDSGLISGSDDKTIRSRNLDLSNSQIFGSPNVRHTGKVTALVLSYDGKILVSGSADKTVKIWFLESKSDPYTLTGFAAPITFLAISPNDEFFAIGSFENNIRIRRLEDGKIIRSTNVGSGVNSLCFSPDGKLLAVGGFNHLIKLWNVETGEEFCSLSGHEELISSIQFSPDGKQLISSSGDSTIKIWQIENQKLLETLRGHANAITSMVITNDGKTIISGSADKRIGIWKC